MMAMEQSEGRANVYLFSGAEEWLKREALDKLRAKWLVPGLEALNETVLEGATAQQIIDAAETVPVPFSAAETAATETPARSAISFNFTV